MLNLILRLVSSAFQSRRLLILENVALRRQLQVLGRQKKRPQLTNRDRAIWILLRRLLPDWKRSLVIVKPESVIGWHRQRFRAFWRRKSQRRSPGRPRLDRSERELIRQIAHDNSTWGAPRIHGELLKLGIFLSPTTVAKYMNYHGPPSQGWRTFLKDHAEEIVSVDFFTVPTISCQVLYVFLLIHNASRRIVHFNVTAHPTMEWTARQLVEAFPRDSAPAYLLRDNDAIYGQVFLE